MNYIEQLNPSALLTYYQDRKQKKAYFELHKVVKGKILSGKPLTKEVLSKMLELVSPDKKVVPHCAGLLSTNVLYFNYSKGKRVTVWFTKAQKQTMHFSKGLGIKDGAAWQPPLLWIAKDTNLTIYVLSDNKRPTLKSKLYEAKYPNVSNGSLCTGTAPKDKLRYANTVEQMMELWHRIFWDSKFSHKSNIEFWKKQIKTGAKYPLVKLKQLTTLEKIIQSL